MPKKKKKKQSKPELERCRWGLTYGGTLKGPDGCDEEISLSLCSLE